MYLPDMIRKECLRRGLSIRTIKTYDQCIKKFFSRCNKDPFQVNKRDIQYYLDKLIERGSSGNTINVNLNALKFFYEQILHRKLTVNLRYSKKPKSLPEFLTKEEVVKLINSIPNQMHRLMIKLLYSAGLRVSELVNLKLKDFDFENNHGWVRGGKFNKDRLFIIADNLKQELKDIIFKENISPESFIFKGRNGHYSINSIQAIINNAAKKAGISKNVHPHTLRHSFATHLIQNGYDVSDVQFLLGHSRTETTMIYVHMASPNMISIKSPLDSLVA